MAQSESQLKNLEKGKEYRFTTETAAKAGKKGNEVSLKKRRELKTMREAFQVIGRLGCTDEEASKILEAMGISATRLAAATLKMAAQAESGNVDAFKVWRDAIGESPKMSVGLAVEPGSVEELKQLSDAQLAELAASNDMLDD